MQSVRLSLHALLDVSGNIFISTCKFCFNSLVNIEFFTEVTVQSNLPTLAENADLYL